MFQLKPISKAAVPDALQKAERYRLLNEPRLAESICRDILEVEPDNHQALIILLLSITDQFGRYTTINVNTAKELLPALKNEYEQLYFSGIISERQGKAIVNLGRTGSQHTAYEWLTEAMAFFEKAEAVRPKGNDDAILRWNTCARLIMNHNLQPRQEHYTEPLLE